jgi:hypothetical protein
MKNLRNFLSTQKYIKKNINIGKSLSTWTYIKKNTIINNVLHVISTIIHLYLR